MPSDLPFYERLRLSYYAALSGKPSKVQNGGKVMVFDKIKDIIVEQLDVEEDAVTMEASITEDLGADSLDVVDLVMSIEESFDVEIPDEEVENIKTVGDIVKYIENKVEE